MAQIYIDDNNTEHLVCDCGARYSRSIRTDKVDTQVGPATSLVAWKDVLQTLNGFRDELAMAGLMLPHNRDMFDTLFERLQAIPRRK